MNLSEDEARRYEDHGGRAESLVRVRAHQGHKASLRINTAVRRSGSDPARPARR
jgi:hypothetical protein